MEMLYYRIYKEGLLFYFFIFGIRVLYIYECSIILGYLNLILEVILMVFLCFLLFYFFVKVFIK